MRSIFWLLLVSSASIAAQPTLRARDDPSTDPNSWPAAVREYFEAVAKEVAQAQGAPNFPNAPPCDLTKAVSPIGKLRQLSLLVDEKDTRAHFLRSSCSSPAPFGWLEAGTCGHRSRHSELYLCRQHGTNEAGLHRCPCHSI